MTNEEKMTQFYKCADEFINLANDLAKDDNSGKVGAALRFAASRYSSFEASMKTKDLAGEKESVKKSLLDDYALMLDENLETYIKHLEKK
jgi:hypothetical protein